MFFIRTATRQLQLIYLLTLCLSGASLMPVAVAAGGITTKVLLCTSQGYQWAEITTESATDNTGKRCLYCVLSCDENTVVWAAKLNWNLYFAPTQVAIIIEPIKPRHQRLTSVQSRAPPRLG